MATQYFKMVHQAFRWRLGWVFCHGWRGQPSSLQIHRPPSYMIYCVYTNALYKNEDMLCSVKRPLSSANTNKLLPADCINFQESGVHKHIVRRPRQRFPPSAAPLEPCRRDVCSVHHLLPSVLFPLCRQALWVTTDPHFPPSFKLQGLLWKTGLRNEKSLEKG